MKFPTLAGFCLLIATTVYAAPAAAPIDSIDVKIAAGAKNHVIVSITNNGTRGIYLQNQGTILDTSPIDKFNVSQAGSDIGFLGIRKRIAMSNLTQILTPLPVNKTIRLSVNAAQLHDLTIGGIFSMVAEGAIPYAITPQPRVLTGVLHYTSNPLNLQADIAAAALALPSSSRLRKRITEQADCTADVGGTTAQAILNAGLLALGATEQVMHYETAEKMITYFGDDSVETRLYVVDKYSDLYYESVATARQSANIYYCTDAFGYCEIGTLAYTIFENTVVNCPIYYEMPLESPTCHADDQVITTLHEMTHLKSLFNPVTTDYAYGFEASTALRNDLKLSNADNWNLYAQSIYQDC